MASSRYVVIIFTVFKKIVHRHETYDISLPIILFRIYISISIVVNVLWITVIILFYRNEMASG